MKLEVRHELKKVNIDNINDWSLIKESDETLVYRFTFNCEHYVVKYYIETNNSFEIQWYKVLSELEIQTLDVVFSTDRCIVFKDFDFNPRYRFGRESDLSNDTVAYHLGRWFKTFHQKGYEYLSVNTIRGANEFDIITEDNIKRLVDNIEDFCGTGDILIKEFPRLNDLFKSETKTFTYRDFWFVNFIVSVDESEAFIFDFDKTGTGLSYNDILYMKMCLSDSAQKSFMEGYGPLRIEEKDIATLYLDLFRLISYLEHVDEGEVPGWVKHHLDKYQSGELKEFIKAIVK